MVPLLALGIPGSGTAAILLGALLLHNITPGPGLFTRHADLVWALAMSMCFCNLLLLAIWPLVRLFRHIQQVPDWILAPVLTVLAFVGVFSVNKSAFSLLIMLFLGLLAYLLDRWHYPLVPLLLGFVLGDLMENYLRRALSISGGDLQILYASNLAKICWGLSLLVVVLPLVLTRLHRKQEKAQLNSGEAE
jgi:putative tricarboxylic transport membrane protein